MTNKLITILIFLYPVFFYGQNIKKTDSDFLQIPTVFHIVNSTELNQNDKLQIENEIKYLVFSINDRLKIIDKNKLENGFDTVATIPKIELILPKCNIENKSINPISWHKVPSYYFRDFIPFIDDVSLNQFGSLDKNHFLNIWIINITDSEETNLAGYVPNKLLNDGVVLDLDDFKFMVQNPFIVIHELGHYLGLKHIWGITGVSSKFHNCRDDDGINDTPSQKAPHIKGAFSSIQNSCDGTQKTNHQNFMDYSYDTGMFTEGQVKVMRNNLKTKRAGLLWKPMCNSTNSSFSVLSPFKQREKLGAPSNFNYQLSFNTNIDLTLNNFFQKELGIVFSEMNLERLGLKLIGTDKFEDLNTRKEVTQDYIYKYLDISKTKNKIGANSDIDRYKRQRIYFDIKKGISSGEASFLYKLTNKEKVAFKKVTNENLVILSSNSNITFNFFKDGKPISLTNTSMNDDVKIFNIESGVYRIICKTENFRLGKRNKPISYMVEVADITFEHLSKPNSIQTILLIRGKNDNRIYHVFEQ